MTTVLPVLPSQTGKSYIYDFPPFFHFLFKIFSFNLVNREGDLLPELTCRGVGQPYLVDFQLRVLPHKNPDGSVPDDEVAATDLKFRCSNVN